MCRHPAADMEETPNDGKRMGKLFGFTLEVNAIG